MSINGYVHVVFAALFFYGEVIRGLAWDDGLGCKPMKVNFTSFWKNDHKIGGGSLVSPEI